MEHKVKVGNPNLRINREFYEVSARMLDFSEIYIEELSDQELQRIVDLNELKEI